MTSIPFLLFPLLGYLIPTALGLGVALLLFKKKPRTDLFLSCSLPIVLWLVVNLFVTGGKTGGNFVLEPFMLAAAALILGITRIGLDGRRIFEESTLAVLNVTGSLLCTLCITFLVPALPE